MIVDSLTITGVTVSLIASIIAIYATFKGRNDNRKELRNVIKHTALMQQDEEVLRLCKAIKAIQPDACPGIDYVLKSGGKNTQAHIESWNSKKPMPSKQELEAKLKQLVDSLD